MSDTDTLLARRADPFETWWEEQRTTWGGLSVEARDLLWALCRKAWYESKRQATR
jgi:hypothetical protein